MTESDWLACESPKAMLVALREKLGERKLRLFTVACSRRVLHLTTAASVKLVVVLSESHADGEVNREVLMAAIHQAMDESGPYQPVREGIITTAAEFPRQEDLYDETGLFVLTSAVAHDRNPQMNTSAYWGLAFPDDPAWKESRRSEEREQCSLLREVFGPLPFHSVDIDPDWLTSTVVSLARSMYESRDFSPMPILADALQDAGCEHVDILDHCRGHGSHVRGCWVVDLLLGKE